MMTQFVNKAIRKLKKTFFKAETQAEKEEKKRMDDYEFLISQGVETEYGYVILGGKPIIQKHPNARIIIGKGVTLNSDSFHNVAGINHPVILAAVADGAVIDLKDGCGLSGTSVVAVKEVVIGKYAMLGVNTNIYDTDFHSMDPVIRKNQKNILQACFAPVFIGENVWIGANSTILKGVRIGTNSVVCAHSLVNRSVGDNELHGGIPSKFIKKIVN